MPLATGSDADSRLVGFLQFLFWREGDGSGSMSSALGVGGGVVVVVVAAVVVAGATSTTVSQ